MKPTRYLAAFFLTFTLVSIFTSCRKEDEKPSFSEKEIKELYQEVGFHHNANLKAILSNVQKKSKRIGVDRLLNETYPYNQIVSNSYQYLVQNEMNGTIEETEYITRAYQDIINSFINETALDVSNIDYNVRALCSDLKSQIEANEFHSSIEIEQLVDNFFNSHINQLSEPVDVISFISFASTVKSSSTFWFLL